VIVSYRFTKLPFTLAALSILWAVAASAAYVMFVGGTIISVEGREIVFRNDGGPGIKKDLGDIVKVRLKGNEKVWLASPTRPIRFTRKSWRYRRIFRILGRWRKVTRITLIITLPTEHSW
jgi:hypothetical protein